MNGIVINIDPVIFHFGSLGLRWYSVAIMLAIVAATFIAAREAAKRGFIADDIYAMVPLVVMGGLVGARLFHVIDRWEFYAANPLSIFQLQQGGLAIWGGLFGGAVVVLIYARLKRLPLRRLADSLVPALLIAQIIGRFGCIVNGDAYGDVTSLPWAFIYVHPGAVIPDRLFAMPTHPYPVYEMLWNGAVLLGLLAFRRRFRADGMLFLSYLSFYSVGRFLLSFVRRENLIFWDLQQAQLLAMMILIISLGALLYLWRKSHDNPALTSPA